jgi:hypothetical protein
MTSHGAQMSTLISWQVAKGKAEELRRAEVAKTPGRRLLRRGRAG